MKPAAYPTYNVPFLWIKNIAPADDQFFKREVGKLGIECNIMQHGDEIEIECLTNLQVRPQKARAGTSLIARPLNSNVMRQLP